jgi:hypothetical protein
VVEIHCQGLQLGDIQALSSSPMRRGSRLDILDLLQTTRTKHNSRALSAFKQDLAGDNGQDVVSNSGFVNQHIQGEQMAEETEEWTALHKGILGVVVVVMLMLVAQIIRYFVSK